MTDEQLKQGQALKSRIDRLKRDIELWKQATGIIEINIQYLVRGGQYLEEKKNFVDEGEFVNFDVLKTLTLQAMRTELEQLEKEYREL